MKTQHIPTNKYKRMLNWFWRQKAKTPTCPLAPSLQGKTVALTGGNEGIGLEVTKGLLERQAKVIILSRNEEKSRKLIEQLNGDIHFIKLDLGDLNSIKDSIANLKKFMENDKIDILINNAGIAITDPSQNFSPQGYELTFAVNVLGHHILFKECHEKSLLSDNAHIIAITGDVYIMADDCTSDFTYKKKNDGMLAYSRSKLGVMWWANECFKLYPQYRVNIVHPGVVPAGLGAKGFFRKRVLNSLLFSAKGGAQMTLICATQPDIENGAYYLNTYGKGILPSNDPALNTTSSKNLWLQLEAIYNNNY